MGRAASVSKRSRFMGEWPGCGGFGVLWVGSFSGMCSTNWGATATAIPRPVPLIVAEPSGDTCGAGEGFPTSCLVDSLQLP